MSPLAALPPSYPGHPACIKTILGYRIYPSPSPVVNPSLMHILKEYFADFAPILPSLFSLNHAPTSSRPLYGSSPNTWDPAALERAVQGVTAALLSLKKKPVIRYERMSAMARKLGVEIQVRPETCSLFLPRLNPTSRVECSENQIYLTSVYRNSPLFS